ncbi:MAG: hypothetical protein Q4C05_09020 [Akkermansia sp.]|nr:hypothetical protein [Akkermansia sp.]
MFREKFVRAVFFALRWGVGGFFLYTASMKLLYVNRLQTTIESFYIVPESWSHPLACLGIACEIIVGIGLMIPRLCAGAALLGSVLTATFVGLFVQAWVRGLPIQCNCTSLEVQLVQNYPFEIAWRVALFLAMLVILWNACRKTKTYFNVARLDFSEM